MDCNECEKKWHVPDTDFNWYKYLIDDVRAGKLASEDVTEGCGVPGGYD